jgi:adenylate kinase family enzyme
MTTPIALPDAPARLAEASRILVIGCSGSGKSTLASALSKRYSLRHISLDRDVFWMPGWTERPKDEAFARIAALVQEDRWVMDGTSPGSMYLRLPRTDLVIWLRPPRLTSLRGAFGRWLSYAGRTRPEMAPGCPEKIDFEFLHYIWTFERLSSPRVEENLARHGAGVPLLTLKSRDEMNRLLAMAGVAIVSAPGKPQAL